jgi:transketolase
MRPAGWRLFMREAPYATEVKPYGRALVGLARRRGEVLCLSGDLTRQTEVDLFQAEFPDRFIHAGMAEANMMGMAGALARCGYLPFVHTFGVFATRRPFDQIANAIAYPGLPVRIIGFMPGVSTPGGPSHQAIDDVALMRALPNMTVIDVADAVQTRQVVETIADLSGPVYVRLKRGEIPVIFDEDHVLRLGRAEVLTPGTDVALFASGMMVAAALAAARALGGHGVSVCVVNVPVIKPLDEGTVRSAAAGARIVVTAENHSVIGGLGSAVAETIAEAGLGRPLRRIGLRDTFAEGAADAGYLFTKYGLSTQAIIETIWSALGKPDRAPTAPDAAEGAPAGRAAAGSTTASGGRYSPVLPLPVLSKLSRSIVMTCQLRADPA